jgi:signal peptidase I
MKQRGLFILFPVLLVSVFGLFLTIKNSRNTQPSNYQNPNYQTALCYTTEEKIVRGESLSPLIRSGDEVKILIGYYDCHKIEREDIVAYDYKGDDVPIIKIVKGLPKDQIILASTSSGWNILINGQAVKNSEGKEYLIGGQGYNMLSLYIRDYQGKIPENAYLILGNIASGTVDSTVFGLIDKSDILGKVELVLK